MLKDPRALHALRWAGFACRVLDIAAALVVYSVFGLKPIRLLQGIASGLLGPRAFNGGVAAAGAVQPMPDLPELNPVVHGRLRLALLSLLSGVEQAEFTV